ncbi:MAG: NADPH:quinone oxidoreductase family protein [Alphaproteobacteria bacterium]
MRALLCKELGAPLVVENVPEPGLGAGEVRVAMHACGVNFADLLIVAGKYQERPELPFTPGMEGAGVVLEVAPEVSRVAPGDRVMTFAGIGACAEESVVPEDGVLAIPEAMDFVTAAGFAVVYGTAHLALNHRAGLKPGEVLLVHAAAGGVGLAAVEVGKAMGARVIGAAGSPEKCTLAKQHGADETIDYRAESIRDRVKELTDGRGADVVFDPVGGDAFDAGLRCTAWEGRILVVGFASGQIPKIPANLCLIKNISAIGVYWGAYRKRDPAVHRASFEELFRMFEAGKLQPHISATFELSDANEAYARLGSRKSTGKLVLTTAREAR